MRKINSPPYGRIDPKILFDWCRGAKNNITDAPDIDLFPYDTPEDEKEAWRSGYRAAMTAVQDRWFFPGVPAFLKGALN
jgi:hypothetical protein